jgi:hypothetical protein
MGRGNIMGLLLPNSARFYLGIDRQRTMAGPPLIWGYFLGPKGSTKAENLFHLDAFIHQILLPWNIKSLRLL